MKNLFFKPEEDLNKIIENIISPNEIKSINKISTGWTNIVVEVTTKNDIYYFRFPRDDFWAEMIVKDYHFCQFIYGKTSFKTPDMKLHYDGDRPFSMHKKIEGICLTERMNNLSVNEINIVTKGICKFINELANININTLPENCNMRLYDFLDELCKGHFSDITLWHDKFFKENDQNYIVHGDLNPGNILIDDNNQVVGILDFCFAGVGNPYSDVGWFISRSPLDFRSALIKAYENEFHQKMNLDILDGFVNVWLGIGQGYTDYIRKHNPDIKLPS